MENAACETANEVPCFTSLTLIRQLSDLKAIVFGTSQLYKPLLGTFVAIGFQLESEPPPSRENSSLTLSMFVETHLISFVVPTIQCSPPFGAIILIVFAG